MLMSRKFGWIKDAADTRDYKYVPTFKVVHLPPAVSLVEKCPPIYDQGNLGSCTANSGAGALEFTEKSQEPGVETTPSRIFIYYNTREIEGTVDSDAGGMLRDTLKTLAKQGACPETEWPYDISKFTKQPTPVCYTDALKTQATVYYSVNQTLNDMKSCLAEGFPFTAGIQVFDNFPMDLGNPNIPMPLSDSQIQGGHAVLICGYNDSTKMFTLRNSWGKEWGNSGYGYIPYAYLLDPDLASDFWTIRKLTLENIPVVTPTVPVTANDGCSAAIFKLFGIGK